MTTYEIPIQGMTCQHCVSSVKSALEHLPGVHEAQVSLEDGKAVVRADEDGASLQQMREIIEEEGYTPG